MFKNISRLFNAEVEFDAPYNIKSTKTLYLSFAMQRSGQHLIIDWFCRGQEKITHLNHCRFYKRKSRILLSPMIGRTSIYNDGNIIDSGKIGRFSNYKFLENNKAPSEKLIFTVEDYTNNAKFFESLIRKRTPIVFYILRDPANWLASSLAHQKHSLEQLRINIENLKYNLRQALCSDAPSINYNRFVCDVSYRKKIASEFGLPSFDEAEKALSHTPDFGGGSSFSNNDSSDFFSRWRKYENDSRFIKLLDDDELIELSKEYFGELPGPLA